MNDTPDITSGPPGDDGTRDPLAFIDEAAAKITPADVRQRLNATLRQAGYQPTRPDSTDLELGKLMGCPSTGAELGGLLGSAATAAGLEEPLVRLLEEAGSRRQTPRSGLNELIQRTADELRAARADLQEAILALAAARTETSRSKLIVQQAQEYADKKLDEANQAASDAREKADQIIAEARTTADQIICGAHEKAEQVVLSARQGTETPVRQPFHAGAYDSLCHEVPGSHLKALLAKISTSPRPTILPVTDSSVATAPKFDSYIAALQRFTLESMRVTLESMKAHGFEDSQAQPRSHPEKSSTPGPSRDSRWEFPQNRPRMTDLWAVVSVRFLDDVPQQENEQDRSVPGLFLPPGECKMADFRDQGLKVIRAIQEELEISGIEGPEDEAPTLAKGVFKGALYDPAKR